MAPQRDDIFKQKVNDCVQHIILQKFTNFHAIRLWNFQNICNEIGCMAPFFAPPCSLSHVSPKLQCTQLSQTRKCTAGRLLPLKRGSRGSAKSVVIILGLWDPITSEPLIQTISSLYSINTARSDLFNGEGLESIRVRVFEISNYTLKNGCFDMCWPIWINDSVTEQCEMREVYLH